MEWIAYLLAAALLLYSIFSLVRHFRRGGCKCGCGGCANAAKCSQKKPPR